MVVFFRIHRASAQALQADGARCNFDTRQVVGRLHEVFNVWAHAVDADRNGLDCHEHSKLVFFRHRMRHRGGFCFARQAQFGIGRCILRFDGLKRFH